MDDADQTPIDENTNDSQQNKNQTSKNRKRKAATEEQTENNADQEKTEDYGSAEATNAKESEENEKDSGKNPKVTPSRKETSEKASGQKKEVGSKTENESTRNKENKKEKDKSSTAKAAVHPPISEMVLDSFRSLRKRNGTSVEDVCKCIEENFQVNINRIKPHVKKFLQKGVAEGLFDLTNGKGGEEKFKIKKVVKVNRKIPSTKMARVKKAAPRIRKETGKSTRKTKNDKNAKPKKRLAA